MNGQDKELHEHIRTTYSGVREQLKKSMDKINAFPIKKKDESADLSSALNVRKTINTIGEKPIDGDSIDLDGCLNEAISLRKTLMESRAKCVSNGFPSAARVFTESIESVTKLISQYEKKKRDGGVDEENV